ncbi:hypothetical protein D3C72_1628310 [compost metagenome]
MVVLDHHAVVQAQPVVQAAAAGHRMLFQRAQARRGLAAVDQARLGMGNGLGIGCRMVGDAAQTLHDVQRGALGRQDAACIAAHVKQHRAFFNLVAVGDAHIDRQRRIVAREDACRHVDAGDKHRLAGVHAEGAGLSRFNHGLDGQVADADVFGQPEVDQLVGGENVVHEGLLNGGCGTS